MKKILVVDDNQDNMALMSEIMEDAGYSTVEFEEAESALAYLETNTVDLVLMDISLPKMNGLEATKLLKASENTKNIPIFILSAYAMSKDIEAGEEAGCDQYITKPIDEDLLLQKIATVLHS